MCMPPCPRHGPVLLHQPRGGGVSLPVDLPAGGRGGLAQPPVRHLPLHPHRPRSQHRLLILHGDIENSCRWRHGGHRHLLLLLQQLRQQAVAAAQGRRGAPPRHQGGPHVRAGEAGGGEAGTVCACAGRAGNEPSRSLKFHNYGQGPFEDLLRVLPSKRL